MKFEAIRKIVIEKLEKMRNVKVESLSSRIAKYLKVMGDLTHHAPNREKLRDALQYFIRKVGLGFKYKENKRVMKMEFSPCLEIISAPDGI